MVVVAAAAVGDHIVIQRSRLMKVSPSSIHGGHVALGISILSETGEEIAKKVILWARTGRDIYPSYPYFLVQNMFTLPFLDLIKVSECNCWLCSCFLTLQKKWINLMDSSRPFHIKAK